VQIHVTVDDREPAGLVRAVREHPDVASVEMVRLPAGDLVIDGVGFERKTLRDYVSAAMARSGPDLDDQVRRLNERYAHAYVLLEGNLDGIEDLRTGVPASAVRGSIASVIARHGVTVLPCSDREQLVDMATRIGRKHVEEPSDRRLPTGSVAARNEPTAKRMYACIDGIGPRLAAALYESYPSVEALLSASLEELREIDGIGKGRARRIHDALREG
jgi:DNA excision repair protein ERCC-4